MYNFTLAKNLTRDLRNYHSSVADQISAQNDSEERDTILNLLSNMEDELVALEEYVAKTSTVAAVAAAKAKLAAVQAELDALGA